MNFQKGLFEKITLTLKDVVLIQVYFLSTGSKQKIKVNTGNTIPSSYHSKVRYTINMRAERSCCSVLVYCNVSFKGDIFHGAAFYVAPSKNKVEVISVHLIRKKFLSFLSRYLLATNKKNLTARKITLIFLIYNIPHAY